MPKTKTIKPILLTLLVGILGVHLVSPFFGIVLAASFWFWNSQIRKKRAQNKAQRQYAIELEKELPDLIDLFIIALSSGLTVPLSIEEIAERVEILPKSQHAFKEALIRVRFGMPLASSLEKCPEVLSPLTVALIDSNRYGVELVSTLETISAYTKQTNRLRAEAEARKIPIKLLFPLVVCIMPAFGLLTLMPIFIRSFQTIINQ